MIEYIYVNIIDISIFLSFFGMTYYVNMGLIVHAAMQTSMWPHMCSQHVPNGFFLNKK